MKRVYNLKLGFSFWLGLPLAVSIACTALGAALAAGGTVSITDPAGREVVLYRDSHALLIASGNYTKGWSRLTNVESEIRQVASALEQRGFNVRTVPHPTGQELRDAINDFIADYGYDLDNRLLIFFSGHGYTRPESDVGYIVPVDAPDPIIDERGFLRTAISMHEVMTWARKIEAKHALFVFDSCFSGSLFEVKSKPKPGMQYIRRSTAKPVRQFITAGDAGQEVPARSVFTPQFIHGLDGAADTNNDNYVTGIELGLYLMQSVPDYNPDQNPQYGKIRDSRLDKGDFVFRVGEQQTAPKRHRQSDKPPTADMVTRRHQQLPEVEGLYAKRDLQKGTILKRDALRIAHGADRIPPDDHLRPYDFDADIRGSCLHESIKSGEYLTWDHLTISCK